MTKGFQIIALASGFLFASCGSSKQAASETANAIKGAYLQHANFGGDSAVWSGIPVNESPSGTVQYAIANNRDEVYVRLKVSDPAEQMKLLSEGLRIYFSPYEKKDRTTSIIYPVKGELNQAELYAQPESGGKLNRETIHRRIGIQLVSLNRTGFRPEYNGVQSIRENTGFKAALVWASDDLIYELAVPIKALPFPLDNNRLALVFHMDALERPAGRAGDGGNTDAWSGGGMGRRGGGYGGRRSGGYNQSNQANGVGRRQTQKAFENEEFAVSYDLAPAR